KFLKRLASRPSSASKTNFAGGTASYWKICKYLKEGGKETVDQEGVGSKRKPVVWLW
ncbi:hypothetical protein WUBG_17213, partial [Wuchereria bancrofti]